MSWHYDHSGNFKNKDDAIRWARQNGYDVHDIRTHETNRGTELEIRRGAKDDGIPDNHNYGKRNGFF